MKYAIHLDGERVTAYMSYADVMRTYFTDRWPNTAALLSEKGTIIYTHKAHAYDVQHLHIPVVAD